MLFAAAMSMLVSFSVSPSTVPLTVTWCPACAATLSCASTTYTFLSASFTNTYLAPCSLTHLVVHSPALSFAPLTPHWLSEIQPVHEPSAAIARAPANSVAAIATANRTFMISPSRNPLVVVRSAGPPISFAHRRSSVQTLPKTYYGGFLFPHERQRKKGGFSGILPVLLCAQGVERKLLCRSVYCPEVAVLAEAAPAAFGTLRYPVAVVLVTLLTTSSRAERVPPV